MIKIKRNIVKIEVECQDAEVARIIQQCLEPENTILGEKTVITTSQKANKLLITIDSSASISSIRFTLDDILHTIRLTANILLNIQE
ncbi:MAG: KEOPS complex subunit Pcc1 [Candidatus Heimdallarchaeaceae archaeon]